MVAEEGIGKKYKKFQKFIKLKKIEKIISSMLVMPRKTVNVHVNVSNFRTKIVERIALTNR